MLQKRTKPRSEVVCKECNKPLIKDTYSGTGGQWSVSRGTMFCSLACETNFRYRMKRIDPRVGVPKKPESVRKL